MVPVPSTPHPILITDATRLPDPLPVMARLPRGAAVIIRHYEWSQKDRLALLKRMKDLAGRRGIRLLLATPLPGVHPWIPDGIHLPEYIGRHGPLARILLWRRARADRLLSMACHDRTALGRARHLGLDMALISPILPTASHPGMPTLGPSRAAFIARGQKIPLAALGGLTRKTAQRLPSGTFMAIAGIFMGPFPLKPR
ncbi:thiamine phosphate synthase [Rhodospirillum sp. A1_3_36]|uniref:thiamine phosphate synthase n=1 Tax=Rhodospirillum sp. A1_3_36 TaxID=3391666 RepID=UPI0039A70DCB